MLVKLAGICEVFCVLWLLDDAFRHETIDIWEMLSQESFFLLFDDFLLPFITLDHLLFLQKVILLFTFVQG